LKDTSKWTHSSLRGAGGSSQESSWRKSRQELSQKAAQDFGGNSILTAHHATDLVETMIFRLTKGCGISGLSPFDISTKPFWQIPKTELINYAKQNNLKWHEDTSNLDTDFQRNLIRQNILPQLRKITPNLEKVFVKESIIFSQTQDFLNQQINLKNNLKLQDFQNLHSILQKEFLRKISKTTPSFSEIKDCLNWLKNNPQGNSKKEIGKTKLSINKNNIFWK
jgi:tRNA(Ile)-lysidine synthase